jgi:salicylate hydroxylase
MGRDGAVKNIPWRGIYAVQRKTRVVIVGAGIGGLTAALALLKKGFHVEILEQAPEVHEIGAGVQISPNGTRVLFALGVGDELRRDAFEPTGKELRLWNTGATWKLYDVGARAVEQYGYPYLTMHRADLHGRLLEAVRREKNSVVHLGAMCVGFSQDENGVVVQLRNGSSLAGDILIGADGLHSRVRQQLFGRYEATFTGGVCWRGLIPASRLPDRLNRGTGSIWIGPNGHVIVYSVRRGELVNFVGHVNRQGWQVESWTEAGTMSECLADFDGWHPDILEMIRAIDTPFKWALFLREPLPQWTSGRVSLLGDACHPTLPYLAQGANMAIEDGLVLARCLEAYEGDVNQALLRYENARRDRTARIVRQSADNLGRFRNPALAEPASAQKYFESEWSSATVDARYDWLFKYDAVSTPI